VFLGIHNLIMEGRKPELPEDIRKGYYVGPTIFTGVTPEMTIYKEEIFGPVVSVVKVGCINTVPVFLPRISDTPSTSSRKLMSVWWVLMWGSRHPIPICPVGGIKDSHLGTNKVQGKDGIDFFIQNKIATIRYTAAGVDTNLDAKDGAIRSCVAS
jgi:malonate-semialdehyde dehydrogenase (acetylating)/methylmalonate-semialdehyde dehydrogenase